MGLIKTNDKCIGCNKCIRACSSMGANVAVENAGTVSDDVCGDLCEEVYEHQ